MVIDEYAEHREFTARHVGPPARDRATRHFPLWVSLYYEIKDSPPPGTGSPIRWPRPNSGGGSLPVRVAEGGAAMNPIKAWNRFLFGPISARPLGLFRIVFGLLIMIYLAMMTVEFDHWYTGAGLLQGTEAREAAGPFRILAAPVSCTNPITPRICPRRRPSPRRWASRWDGGPG